MLEAAVECDKSLNGLNILNSCNDSSHMYHMHIQGAMSTRFKGNTLICTV